MQLRVLRRYVLYKVTKNEEVPPCHIVDLHVSIVGLQDVAGALTRIVFLGPLQHASLKCIDRYVPINRRDPSCLFDISRLGYWKKWETYGTIVDIIN